MSFLSYENKYVFIDSFKNEYKFYLFTDVKGNKHLGVIITYFDGSKNKSIFESTSFSFGFPLNGNTILWDAYNNSDFSPQWKNLSAEARNMADKLVKLKIFF